MRTTVEAGDGWVDSPFKTKGVLYLGTQTFFEAQSPRGIEVVAEQLPPGRLQDFVRQKFLPGGQYEVLVVPTLIAAEARAMGQSLDRYLLERTRWQADRDIHGVYKLLLKLTSAETVVLRLPKLITQMFSFGTSTVTMEAPKHAVMTVHGVPGPLVSWLQVGFKVYCERAVQLAGGKDPVWNASTPSVEPSQEGFPMRTLRGVVTWG